MGFKYEIDTLVADFLQDENGLYYFTNVKYVEINEKSVVKYNKKLLINTDKDLHFYLSEERVKTLKEDFNDSSFILRTCP